MHLGSAVSSRPSRAAVAVLYLSASVPVGSWIGRIPDIKAGLGASDAAWGWANSLGTLGELSGFAIVALLIGQLSTRRMAMASAVGIAVVTPMLASSPTLTALVLSLFVWMVANKTLGTTMGALALVEQRRAGRVLMGRYDAVYSAGMLVGGGIAWACIQLQIAASWQFAATNLTVLVGLVLSVRHLPDEERSATREMDVLRRLRRRLRPSLVQLAGVSFLAAAIDSSLSQWGALFVTSMSDGGTASGALVYPLTMTAKIIVLVRLGTVVRRWGWSFTIYASLAVVAVAVLAAATTRTPTAALVSCAFIGAGTAVLGPFVNTGAGEQPGITAGEARTVLELGEIPAYVLLPAVFGLLSAHVGIGTTLGITIVLATIGCAALAHRFQPDRSLPSFKESSGA